MPEKGIFLVGFMASGKSAVGRLLARRLGRDFVDTDREIERVAKKTVPELFAAKGEKAFRVLEARAVASAAGRKDTVVALGGGAVLNRASVAKLRRSGTVVYIEVPFFRLWARAHAAGLHKRPLLAAQDDDASRARMEALHSERRPIYKAAAHITVNGADPADEVAARIERRLGKMR